MYGILNKTTPKKIVRQKNKLHIHRSGVKKIVLKQHKVPKHIVFSLPIETKKTNRKMIIKMQLIFLLYSNFWPEFL